jgi:hypothetical protein
MSDEDIRKLVTSRQSKLETLRSPMESVWQSVSEFVNIGLGDIKSDVFNADWGKKSFNGTAIGAAVLATDGIHGYHVSPSFPWFSYEMSRNVLNKVPDIREWLQHESEEIYSALNSSNFYSEMWPYIFNGFTIGSVGLYAEYDIETSKIVFDNVHPREAYFSVNRFNEVDVFHRKRKLTARQIVQKFGLEKCPEVIKNAYRNDPFQDFEIIHAVFPREERNDQKKDAKNKKYASVWYATGNSTMLSESGYDEFPYKVWRYMRMANSVYGLCPAILSMADIKGSNIISKTLLGAAQMHIDPPLNVPAAMKDKVQWKPRGINPYDTDGMFVKPAVLGGTFPVGLDREEKVERSIRERFHVDTFLMLSQMEGRGQKTAYEVSEMMGEKAAILGAELAPLNTVMDSVLELVYSILAERDPANDGSITPRPDILYDLAMPGDSFSPMYQGPLAQAQRRMFKTQGIQAGLQVIAPIIEAFPGSADVVNADETVRTVMESFNFPQKTINDQDSVDAIREARTQAMAAENQKQDMLDAVGGVETLTRADANTDGALAGAVGNAMKGAA